MSLKHIDRLFQRSSTNYTPKKLPRFSSTISNPSGVSTRDPESLTEETQAHHNHVNPTTHKNPTSCWIIYPFNHNKPQNTTTCTFTLSNPPPLLVFPSSTSFELDLRLHNLHHQTVSIISQPLPNLHRIQSTNVSPIYYNLSLIKKIHASSQT